MKWIIVFANVFVFKVISSELKPCVIKDGKLGTETDITWIPGKNGVYLPCPKENVLPGNKCRGVEETALATRSGSKSKQAVAYVWPGSYPNQQAGGFVTSPYQNGYIFCPQFTPNQDSWIPNGPWLDGSVMFNGCVWFPGSWDYNCVDCWPTQYVQPQPANPCQCIPDYPCECQPANPCQCVPGYPCECQPAYQPCECQVYPCECQPVYQPCECAVYPCECQPVYQPCECIPNYPCYCQPQGQGIIWGPLQNQQRYNSLPICGAY